MPTNNAHEHVTIIQPKRSALALDLHEIWHYRELFGQFVIRDFQVRYKQSLLGLGWAVIGPLVTTVVFTLIFGRVAKLPSDGLPPAVFYMAGLVIWRYFQTSLLQTSLSMVMHKNLLTKIYVPRLIIPISKPVTGLVDFLIAFILLLLIMAFFGVKPAVTIVYIPFLVIVAMCTVIGVGTFFAAVNVRYRDAGQIVPFITQLWMYATIIVPFSRIPERFGVWRYLYGLNPMAGVVEGFRWCLLHPQMTNTKTVQRAISGGEVDQAILAGKEVIHKMADGHVKWIATETIQQPVNAPWALVGIGLITMTILLLAGVAYFRRVERQFADII